MPVDFTSIALLFSLPIIILWHTQRVTARLWVAIYLASVLSNAVVVNVGVSFLWFLGLGASILSTGLLILFTAVLVPPGQRAILLPFLSYTQREPGSVGINQKQTYDPSAFGKEIEIDIIAVNGLGSHPLRTWMARDASQPRGTYVSWLKMLLPHDFPNARIMSFQQDTSYLVNAPVKTIEECGGELLRGINLMRASKEEKNRPILFIGHSFGGIVIKEALVQAKEKTHPDHAILKSTIGILFLGTPHNGAWSTALGDIIIDCTSSIGSNCRIMDDLRYRSEKLTELQRDFEDCYNQGIMSIYESRRTLMGGFLPIMVVDEDLARIRNECERPIKLNTDHSGLNKFASRDDGNYKEVIAKIAKLIDIYDKVDDDNIEKCLHALQVSMSAPDRAHKRRELPKDFDARTCRWVEKQVDEFCRVEHTSRALIFRGSPGSGKSVLSRYIMDLLERSNAKLAYFAFKDDSSETSHAESAVRMLIRQMLLKDRRLYRHIQNYKEACQGNSWPLEYLLRVFRNMISDDRSRSLVIVLDALNECDDQSRWELLDGLASSRLLAGRFIITSQDVPEMMDTFPKSVLIELDNLKDVKDAVETFIDQKVDQFFDELISKATARPKKRVNKKSYEQLRAHMLTKLKEDAGHMFLWVHLVIERLRGIKNSAPDNIRTELDALPANLIPVYEKIFQQVLKEGPDEVARNLPWILYAKRPLVIEELRDALAIQDCKKVGNEDRSFEGCRSDVVEDDLRKTFGSLVVIEKPTREIRLFHHTLRGALLGISKPPSEILRDLCVSAKEAHTNIAIACLDYLTLEKFGSNSADEWELFREAEYQELAGDLAWQRFEDLEFLEYAARMWPYHVRQAGEENEQIMERFDTLAALPNNLELAYRIFNYGNHLWMGRNMLVTYQLCCYGLEKLAIRSLPKPGSEQCQDLDKPMSTGEHLIHEVANVGFLKLLDVLLNKYNADLYVKDSEGQTIMHYATQGGEVGMIKYLIDSGFSLQDPGRDGMTPLHYAACEHQLDAIDLLLEHGASCQARDSSDLTPRQYLHLYIATDCRDPRCLVIAAKMEE
ncbi:hypothetical protein F4802DRAFT_73932 [Xylaria palmicola]|nr:hypothetical protein F4802DRAFT_73932 [Xylaria palmicola]